MIVNLKSAKARFSEIVDRAYNGEEVWVTVRGKPKVRVSALPADEPTKAEKRRWLQSVREARSQYGQTGERAADEQGLWDDLRGK